MNARHAVPHKKLTLKERRRRARLFFLYALITLGIALLVGAYFGLRHSAITIHTIDVSPTLYIRSELIRTAVEESLTGAYFFLVPRANAFFVPEESLERMIADVFHAVEAVEVTRTGFTSLSVQVTERVPDALWCDSFTKESRCFFLDDDGFIFSPRGDEEALRVFSGGLSGDPMGRTYLEGAYPRLRDFLVILSISTKRTPKYINVDEYGDVRVGLVEGGDILFTLNGTSDELADTIASVFASRRFETGETLEYADFRFGSKVYVKFVGE